MKRIFFSLFTALSICTAAQAQDWVGTNRDEFGNIVRGAYLTNEWFDNWFISAAGGISFATSKTNDVKITPQFDFGLLKWFTPSIGMRLGYQGFNGKEVLTIPYNPYQINHSYLPYDKEIGQAGGTLSYGLMYIHGDLLWNLTNSFGGYKRDRFYNVSVYAHTGFVRLYDRKGKGYDNEWGLGAGLYNTFRLADRFVLTLDLRHMSTASRYKVTDGTRTNRWSAFVGVAFNIYRTYWNRAQTIMSENSSNKANAAAAQQALQSANAEKDALVKKIAEKESEIASLKAAKPLDKSEKVVEVPYNDLVARAQAADHIVYYYINVDKANFSELRHLDDYIVAKLKQNPDHVFYLTGSADKGTGTFERNTFLCRSRAYGVRDILIKDYNVKPENVVIKETIVSDKHLDGQYDRCVIIESE